MGGFTLPVLPMPVLDLGPTAPLLMALAALLCVVVAAGWDMAKFEIPDTVSVLLLVLAAAYGLLTPGFGWLSHLLAPLGFFALGLLLFARGWLGGGDIKLMTALAAWTGLSGLLPLLLGISIAGGVLALVLIIARRVNAGRSGMRLLAVDAPLPYAVAILAGVLWWASLAWPIR
ncbi:prepilin peptidase CpaA [Polymorphobacter multimanifer]|uniref:Prepilin peptidase CpaA n=2 Tax=Polymorphobacter multimanifer TaxID=1070431 RepID=A0A841L6M1_9SPHN|nr:prepilin peptidase [Polymorphobacter multimanifer]MBB6226603.1 prepilin peptidase CpaA [Polymorphobacter multimanifer]